MYKSIEEADVFNKKDIHLGITRLSATDVECVSLFLTSSSHKQWEWLVFNSCYIQDYGPYIIHKYLKQTDMISVSESCGWTIMALPGYPLPSSKTSSSAAK